MTHDPKKRKAVDRLDIVSMYLSMGYAAAAFAEKFNRGEFYPALRRKAGPINARDLERGANVCMGVAQ
jgi:hypothetical protein